MLPSWGRAQEPRTASAAETIARTLDEAFALPSGAEVKCGTSLWADAALHWGELTPQAHSVVQSALQRLILQKSRVSAQGHFRAHYDTLGFRQPALLANNTTRIPDSHEAYVDSVLGILEEVWNTEIGELGYRTPPPDGVKGGGPEYDVYVLPQQSGLFGATYWEPDDLVSSTPNERYATYMEIDDDYLGYRTPGLDGLRVTCAHEFFHAIQVGASGIWRTATKSDFYFYELASTWMEDVVYDAVNDYLYEVRAYLSVAGGKGFRDLGGRAYSFTTYGVPTTYYGYERALFAHFLEKKFGRILIRDVWESMRERPFLGALQTVLDDRGTSLEREFSWFSIWNYYTADRADSLAYYPEGASYPRFDPNMRMPYNDYFATISTSGAPLTDQHFEFIGSADTIHAAVANVDVGRAATSNSSSAGLAITASSSDQSGTRQVLSNGVHMSVAVDDPDLWRTVYLLSSTRGDARASGAPSPNPLSLASDPVLTIPVDGAGSSDASVFVLSSSLDLVFSREIPVVEVLGRPVVQVHAADLRSSVSSGIHFLVVRAGEVESTWKIAIVK